MRNIKCFFSEEVEWIGRRLEWIEEKKKKNEKNEKNEENENEEEKEEKVLSLTWY